MRFPWLFVVLTACTRSTSPPTEGGRLEAEWTGADTGRLEASATAEWCDSLRVLEIRALQGDSGLALALYPVDSLRPDSYPVLPPARADSLRPAAAVALRWFAETTIEGFRGDSGAVLLAPASQGVSGRFEVRVRSIDDADRLTVRGSFRGASVVPAKRGCVTPPAGGPQDSARARGPDEFDAADEPLD